MNIEKTNAFVGEKIREFRVKAGLTQSMLADQIEISYQQVQKYETGANRVSAGRLQAISICLGVGLLSFFPTPSDEDFQPNKEHGGKSRNVISFAEEFSKIEDKQQKAAVLSLVKVLAGSK